MSRPVPRFTPEPRVWSGYQLACRLGMSEETWRRKRPDYEARGFPRFNDFLGGWDAKAVERWLDAQSGLVSPDGSDDFREEMARWAG